MRRTIHGQWRRNDDGASPYMELYPQAANHPIAFTVLVCATRIFLAAGTRRLTVLGPVHALVALALLLTAPAAYGISLACRHYLFEWYLLFLLPGVVDVLAAGLDDSRIVLSRKIGATAALLVVAGFLAGYVIYTTPQRTWLLARPLQQIRESAQITRPVLDSFAEENENILTASFIDHPTRTTPTSSFFVRFANLRRLSRAQMNKEKFSL